MRREEYKARVEAAIARRPHLLPVYTSVFYVPERVREYNPDLFVVINTIRHLQKLRGEKPDPPPPGVIPKWGAWFEIHSLAHRPNTFALHVKYGELDARILRDLRRTDIRARGEQVFREIDERNERVEQAKQRAWKNANEAIARELYRPFANAAWDGRTIFGAGTLKPD